MDDGVESKVVVEDEPQMDSKPDDLTLKIITEPLFQFENGSVVIFRIRSLGLLSMCKFTLVSEFGFHTVIHACFDFNF